MEKYLVNNFMNILCKSSIESILLTEMLSLYVSQIKTSTMAKNRHRHGKRLPQTQGKFKRSETSHSKSFEK